MNKDWSCEKKQQARSYIVEQYRSRYGHAVPEHMQYWSMAGLCDKPGCEIDQLLESGLVRESQFHGVDHTESVRDRSAVAYPDAHWHYGDFHRVLRRASATRAFRPAIVNADLIQTVETGGRMVSNIMAILSDCADVMLVANFVLADRYHPVVQTGNHVISELNKFENFRGVSDCWDFDGNFYKYAGTGKHSKTTMGMFVFTSNASVGRLAA